MKDDPSKSEEPNNPPQPDTPHLDDELIYTAPRDYNFGVDEEPDFDGSYDAPSTYPEETEPEESTVNQEELTPDQTDVWDVINTDDELPSSMLDPDD
jgi:hypothetical protein